MSREHSDSATSLLTHQFVERFTFIEVFDPDVPVKCTTRRSKSVGDTPDNQKHPSIHVVGNGHGSTSRSTPQCKQFYSSPHIRRNRGRVRGKQRRGGLLHPETSTLHSGNGKKQLSKGLGFVMPSAIKSMSLQALLASSTRGNCRESIPQGVSRLLWTLAKLETTTGEAAEIVLFLAKKVLPFLTQFSTQELSNSLWGLAHLVPVKKCPSEVRSFVEAVARESLKRLWDLSGRGLSNSLWAVARLCLSSNLSEVYTRACAQELMCRNVSLFSPQSLANMLWAVAKTVGRSPTGASASRGACLLIMKESHRRLTQFQCQELSMLAWGVATLHGRSSTATGRRRDEDARLLGDIALEARTRLSAFSPQGVSNVAWALTTVGLHTHQGSRAFLVAAAEYAIPQLNHYPPQAISNLCWALAPLSHGPSAVQKGSREKLTLHALVAAVSRQTMERLDEFEWPDLSGVIVAFAQGRCVTQEVIAFATCLVTYAAQQCDHLTMQVMLNVAHAAVRLGLPGPTLQPMAEAIDSCVRRRSKELNEIDLRQWADVQRHCPLVRKMRHFH